MILITFLFAFTASAQRVTVVTDTNGNLLTPARDKFASSNGLATASGLSALSNSLAARFQNPLTYRATNTGQLYLVGDSIGQGRYSDALWVFTFTNSYFVLVTNALGMAGTNISQSGWCAVDQMLPVFTNRPISAYDINVWAVGGNDARLATNSLPAYRELSLAQIAWLSFADSDKITRSSTNVTYYGTWANDAGGFIGKFTYDVGGAAVISNVYGSSFILGSAKWKPGLCAPSNWRVYVDGTQVAVVTNQIPVNYISNAGYVNNYVQTVYVVTNLPQTTHTVAITNDGGSEAYGTFEWLAAPQMALQKPQVYVLEVTRPSQGTNGYVYWGGSEAGVASFNAALKTNVAMLASIGLDVTYVPVSGIVDPRYDLADGIHPTKTGHAKMADALLNAISGWRRSKGISTLGQ